MSAEVNRTTALLRMEETEAKRIRALPEEQAYTEISDRVTRGAHPWTVTRYWAGMWGRISGQEFPERLPDQIVDYLQAIECDLIDEDDVDESWLTTMADSPYPGPIRDEIRSLVAYG